MNFISNGDKIDNFGQGLGYFAVGAGTSAVSSFAGGNINGAIWGALAGAGISGATSLASNGLNNLLNGDAFWDNWQTNLWTSALMGGISGGISGGMNAAESRKNLWWGGDVKYGRKQWSFFNIEKPKSTLEFSVNHLSGEGEICVALTLAELEALRGGSKSTGDYIKQLAIDPEIGYNASPSQISKLLKEEGFNNKMMNVEQLKNKEMIQLKVDKGENIVIRYKNDERGHLTTIKKINYYESGKVKIYMRGEKMNYSSFIKKTPSPVGWTIF